MTKTDLSALFNRLFKQRPHFPSIMPTLNEEANLAILQRNLQKAIVARGLRMQLESSSDGWQVVLLDPKEVGAPIQVKGEDPAIALLTAYVTWLESWEGET